MHSHSVKEIKTRLERAQPDQIISLMNWISSLSGAAEVASGDLDGTRSLNEIKYIMPRILSKK